ncbi:Uma2 family endonuclease [Actinocrinis sp.]|uniref:Uma2 family endonuclease n=1 Tax=Actinocrinis sp. TaxID=1920516 RepID=UPI002DDCCDE5|nr:Uma2 family endonuclease [Actinocrinis sp.]
MAAELAWNSMTYWDDLPVPYWLTGDLTAEMWDELPENICRRIEVIGGLVVFTRSPSEDHQGAALMLPVALSGWMRDHANRNGLCLRIRQEYDLRLGDDPLHHRKPDVIVYRCVERDELPRPQDALLVIEIVSPSSRVTDKIDKLAEYAEAGVPHYWIVETRNGAVSTVTWYALPEGDKRYEVRACWTPAETPDGIRAEEPFPVRIAWDELAF